MTPCPVSPNDAWAIKDFVVPLTSSLTAFVVAGIGYWLALRQLRHKSALDVKEDLRKRQADALKVAWSLLQSLTQVDNGINIIKVVRPAGASRKKVARDSGDASECSYLMHMGNAQIFVFQTLPHAFYGEGAGLLWPSLVKEHFFHARSIIYGVLLAEDLAHAPDTAPHSVAQAELRPIRNPEAARQLQDLYVSLNELLRKEVQAVYGVF